MNRGTISATYQIFPFALLGFFSFPLFYLLNPNTSPDSYENVVIRIIASALCLPLIFKNYWPLWAKRFLPILWYLTLLYTLPFFFTFMLLKNNASAIWQTNMILLVLLLILVTDWLSFCFLMLLGFLFALVTYLLTTDAVHFPAFYGSWIATFVIATISAFFASFKEKRENEKLQMIWQVASNIAHELRTPLRIISSSASGLREYLPKLIETYKIAKESAIKIPALDNINEKTLNTAFASIELEAESAFNFINMLLINANQSIIIHKKNLCSIITCVEQSISRYPFDFKERELVHFNSEHSFRFQGDELLIIHVLFNLLKNSLYYIKAAGKGEIYINFKQKGKFNILSFKDTGLGMPKTVLPHIFEQFFSKTMHGTGIGLTYCKNVMQSFGGDIHCDSTEGEYTEFTLKFPRVNQDKLK